MDGTERHSGVDETLIGDVANVAEGRGLTFGDRAWLSRAVTGAVRPNRDKPFWDLAHLLAAVARATGADGVIDLALDPRLTRAEAVRNALAGAGVVTDDHGPMLALDGRDWRMGWSGTARLLTLAEFVLTADGLAQFAAIRGFVGELGAAPDREAVDQLSRRLVRIATSYREAHMPIAPVEKRFRAILSFLGERRGGGAFGDGDVLEFWRAEVESGERTQFRTVAEHFVTYSKAFEAFGGLARLTGATSVEEIEGWSDRLDGALADLVGEAEEAEPLAMRLKALPDGPKILTKAERDEVADIVALAPFHRDRPLTVLRSISFGRVQSGIANRLRRGTGGPDVAERAACGEAESYDAVVGRAHALDEHVDRMVRIAAALRLGASAKGDARLEAVVSQAEADLKRVRRAGFDTDRETLAAGFATADDVLADARAALSDFLAATRALTGWSPLPEAFSEDREVFAAAFARAYLAQETAA